MIITSTALTAVVLAVFSGVGEAGASSDQVRPPVRQVIVEAPEHRFAVTLPPGFALPEVETETLLTARGALSSIAYISTGPRGVCWVSVRWMSVPGELPDGSPEEEARGWGEAMLSGPMGSVEQVSSFTMNGFEGRSIRYVSELGDHRTYGRLDVIVAGSRLYTISYTSDQRSDLTSPETMAFFDTFGLADWGGQRKAIEVEQRPEGTLVGIRD